MTKPRIYVDSDVIIGFIKAEPDKVFACGALFNEAKAGKIEVITSSVTPVEVLRRQGDPLNPAVVTIAAFMESRWLVKVQADKAVGLRAQEVRQRCQDAHKADPNRHGKIEAMDALHFASALVWGADRFVTYNIGDYRTAAELYPELVVERPSPSPVQQTLPLAKEQSAPGQDSDSLEPS